MTIYINHLIRLNFYMGQGLEIKKPNRTATNDNYEEVHN